MWVSPMRFKVQGLDLTRTEQLCPRCGGRLGMLEARLGTEYFSCLPGAAVKTQRFLVCTQCGFQPAEGAGQKENDEMNDGTNDRIKE